MSINYALAKADAPDLSAEHPGVQAGVRWLRRTPRGSTRRRADRAIGGSAGGHLTALAGGERAEVGIDPKEDADYSCRIQAAARCTPIARLVGGPGAAETLHEPADVRQPLADARLSRTPPRRSSTCRRMTRRC